MCGHSKRRCGFVRYGLARAGKVKSTNEPEFGTKLGITGYWNYGQDSAATTKVQNVSDEEKISKYSSKNIRKQYERVSNTIHEEIVGARIDKFEFNLEKQMYNELRDVFWNKKYPNPKNHKKWNQNHREPYSNRESIHQ